MASPVSRLSTVRRVCELSKIFMYADSVSCGERKPRAVPLPHGHMECWAPAADKGTQGVRTWITLSYSFLDAIFRARDSFSCASLLDSTWMSF